MNIGSITFPFNTDGTSTVQLEAEVELVESAAYYQIKKIHIAGSQNKGPHTPDVAIKCVAKRDEQVWVHIDSNLPSDLSISIGKRLETVLPAIKLAPAIDEPESDEFSMA